MAAYYNEGVGHGGFVATFTTAGSVIVESFSKEKPSTVINQPDELGAPAKWSGVATFETASALVQLPVSGSPLVPTAIALGDKFTAPNTHGGGVWVVTSVSETFQQGDYFKANLGLQKQYNA